MRVECPCCGTGLSEQNLESPSRRLRCRRCGGRFPLPGEEGKPAPPELAISSLVPLGSTSLPLPSGIRVTREGKVLRLDRRWFTWAVLPLAFFALLWNSFMVVWFTISLSQGLWPMALFGSLHGAIGLAMAYGVLAGLFNVTTLEVEDGRLRVRHFPFYWGPTQELDVRDLRHFFVCEGQAKSGEVATGYLLQAVQANGAHVKILEDLPEVDQALFLEQELGSFLGVSRERPRGSALPAWRTPSRGEFAVSEEPAPLGSVRLEQVHLLEAADCPVCGEGLGDDPVLCPRCATPHHRDCWHYGDGCSTYGCPEGSGGRE